MLRAIAIVALSSCAAPEVRGRASLAERLIEFEQILEEDPTAEVHDQACAATLRIGRTTCVLTLGSRAKRWCDEPGCVFIDGFRDLDGAGELLACGDSFTGCGGTLVCACRPNSATADERPK